MYLELRTRHVVGSIDDRSCSASSSLELISMQMSNDQRQDDLPQPEE
jgi:hypothetical protein